VGIPNNLRIPNLSNNKCLVESITIPAIKLRIKNNRPSEKEMFLKNNGNILFSKYISKNIRDIITANTPGKK
jgi:hypothetical protein